MEQDLQNKVSIDFSPQLMSSVFSDVIFIAVCIIKIKRVTFVTDPTEH